MTLTKVVQNDDGGQAKPDDFKLTVGGDAVLSGVTNTYLANVALALDETMVTGYEFVSITGDEVCPAALGGTVTLQPGDDVSCTITNTDQPASLTLVKTVVGGSATTADFDPYIDQTMVTWGSPVALVPGTYTASEVMNVADYVAGDWGGACAPDGTVSIALGEDLTCTISNYCVD